MALDPAPMMQIGDAPGAAEEPGELAQRRESGT